MRVAIVGSTYGATRGDTMEGLLAVLAFIIFFLHVSWKWGNSVGVAETKYR
jgi:hypothetical protein